MPKVLVFEKSFIHAAEYDIIILLAYARGFESVVPGKK